MMDVKYGKSTANLVQPEVAAYLKEKHPEIVVLQVPLPKDAPLLGCGIGVNKQNTKMIQTVEKIVDQLKASGDLAELEKKWFRGVE